MSVSIIIPAYNSSEFLPAAIESVLSQTCSEIEIEIVVIDDGSTDATKAVCDRYPTGKYIYQSHQGLPSARNKRIDISQGSAVNMGSNLYRSEPVFQQTIDHCAEILQPLLDLDIRQLIYPAMDAGADRLAVNTELLSHTRYTQPALFTFEYALAQLWQSWGLQPTAAIGHSIGEFVAACLAGVFSLADCLLKPVRRFAESVQKLWQHNPSCGLLKVGLRQSLTTLARQQVTDRTQQVAIASLGTTAVDNADWQCLLQAVGQLWLAGVTIDWQRFYAREHRHRVPLPSYPFERQKFWIDPLPYHHQSTPSAIDNFISATTYLQSPMPSAQSEPPAPEPRSVRLMPSSAATIRATAGIEIGANDWHMTTFLELGLDSLALTQVALSLQKKFKVKVTFRQLLEECSTLTAIAQSIDLQLPPDAFPAPVASVAEPANDLPLAERSTVVVPLSTPTNRATTPAISATDCTAIEALVQQQLQIMARQLELLGGNPTVPVDRSTVPIVQIAPEIAPVATNGRENLSSNGTALRIARTVTGRDRIVRFTNS